MLNHLLFVQQCHERINTSSNADKRLILKSLLNCQKNAKLSITNYEQHSYKKLIRISKSLPLFFFLKLRLQMVTADLVLKAVQN